MERNNAPNAEQIETTFRNWASMVTQCDWETTQVNDAWMIFTNREHGIQVEFGYKLRENEVVLKVYDIPVMDGETHLDITINVDKRRQYQNHTPIQVVEDEGMAVSGALNKAL